MKTKLYYALLVVLATFILTSKSYAHEVTQLHTHNEHQLTTENKKTAQYSKQIIDTTYALIFIYLSFWIANKSFKKETSK